MQTLDDVQQQIRALGPSVDLFGTKKEVKYLPDALQDDEKIVQLTSGMMDGNTWLIVCTCKRVLLLDKGLIYGLQIKEINLKSISAVEHKTGLLMGEIKITVSSEQLRIDNVMKQTVKPFVDALNAARRAAEAGNAPASSAPASGADVVIGQLEKLANLRDRGVLTEQEFTEQKAKLLAST